jgi:hypothetical protein
MVNPERDHIAMEALRAASKEGFQIRLSNKAALGYWWAYYDGQVVQANDPAEAVLGIYKTLDVSVKHECEETNTSGASDHP